MHDMLMEHTAMLNRADSRMPTHRMAHRSPMSSNATGSNIEVESTEDNDVAVPSTAPSLPPSR
jgi:hypothetical protein